MLKPVHDWLMEVLSRLVTDGTFHQEAPLDRLRGKSTLDSYDLTAATDRWPLGMLFKIMCFLFDRSFASSVVNSALAYNIFDVPFVNRQRSSVCFVAGQPLGSYSSWPLFALSHHAVVWWYAEQVHPGKFFHDYAMLLF